MPGNKIDFSSFSKPSVQTKVNNVINHDLIDDYMEDLSFDEPSLPKEEPVIKKTPEPIIKPVVEEPKEPGNNVYTNTQEINKIMNKKDDDDNDDFFDEFFD